MKKPLVYIAAPYTHPDPIANTRLAIAAWKVLHEFGIDTIVPHISLLLHLVYPQPIQTWYDYDINIMLHCDAVLRLDGESQGADEELSEAQLAGMPTFCAYDYDSLEMVAAKIVEYFLLKEKAESFNKE